MKMFELKNNKWVEVKESTKTNKIKLYNDDLIFIGYGFY